MDSYLSIANKPIFWVLCSITVLLSFAQALLFMRQAKKTATKIQLPAELPKKAFKIGMISAIGPACGVFIVMVGLMASIGGPMSWLRLSIIGAAATELSAATFGAQAAGVTMGGEDFAYYLQKAPGAFMFLSSANAAKGTDVAHHNPKFDIDEDVLWEGSALFVSLVEDFLNA